ncbi:TniQ family protein [Streptomyces sp. NPDC048717]|uniref:TniQ family protein n=1 Tax=Streptomyces sp. NPDC048717 TaxID=3154928 RepID=UPI003427A971
MTNPRRREQDRAVRAYKRAHPDITLNQARAAVAARSGPRPALPSRIFGAPLPRPGERLESYVKRVAAAAGVQRHRAMELLGLEPGASATERLDQLADGLPDATVKALVAATGMTSQRARALTAPRSAGLQQAGLEALARQHLGEKYFRRGGADKTRTGAAELAGLFAEANELLPLPPGLLASELLSDSYRPVIVELDWPFDAARPPIDPEVFKTVAQALGIEQGDAPDTSPQA